MAGKFVGRHGAPTTAPITSEDGESSAASGSSRLYERVHAARVALERAWTSERTKAERTLKACARELARPALAAATEEIEVLSFRLGAERYAVEPQHVARVCVLDQLAPLPGVPAFVLGIVRVPGEIVAALDLRRLLGPPERGLGQLNTLMVLQSVDMRFGVVMDEVTGMRRLPRGDLLGSLPTLEGAKERYLLGGSAEHMCGAGRGAPACRQAACRRWKAPSRRVRCSGRPAEIQCGRWTNMSRKACNREAFVSVRGAASAGATLPSVMHKAGRWSQQ